MNHELWIGLIPLFVIHNSLFTSVLLPPPYAIDVGERSLKVLLLTPRHWTHALHRVPYILGRSEADIPEGWIVDGDIREAEKLAALIRSTIARTGTRWIRSPFAITALPEARTLLTTITVHRLPEESEEAALRRAIPSVLPIALDTAIVAIEHLADGNESSRMIVATAPTPLVTAYAELFDAAGLTPIGLEVEASAIARAVAFQPTTPAPMDTALIIDCGATRTSAIIARGTTVVASVTIPFSGIRLTTALASALEVDVHEAERMKRNICIDPTATGTTAMDVILDALIPLLDGIARMQRFASSHLPSTFAPQRVILTGGGSQLAGLDTYLAAHVDLPVHRFTIPSSVFRRAMVTQPVGLATVFGLGLAGLDPLTELIPKSSTLL